METSLKNQWKLSAEQRSKSKESPNKNKKLLMFETLEKKSENDKNRHITRKRQ